MHLSRVSKKYEGLRVLDQFNLSLSPGQRYCFFGPSGCGKTTLLSIIAGLTQPDSGNVTTKDMVVSYIFQEDRLLPWETVRHNLLFALSGRWDKEMAAELADAFLERVHLTKFQHSYPSELSGGMKQRLAIARALAYGGDVLLMDEPFKGLDFELKTELIDYILPAWAGADRYFIFVTHDVEEALHIADQIVVFSGPPLTIKKTLSVDLPVWQRTSNARRMTELRRQLKGQS